VRDERVEAETCIGARNCGKFWSDKSLNRYAIRSSGESVEDEIVRKIPTAVKRKGSIPFCITNKILLVNT
jgi:hypothetical protein